MAMTGTIERKTLTGSGGGKVMWTAEEQLYATTENISAISLNAKVTFSLTAGAAVSVTAA